MHISVCIMSHGPGRIQRQMLQILRGRRSLIGTTELALRVYGRISLMPWQRVAAWLSAGVAPNVHSRVVA
jgi:hypothetical protein